MFAVLLERTPDKFNSLTYCMYISMIRCTKRWTSIQTSSSPSSSSSSSSSSSQFPTPTFMLPKPMVFRSHLLIYKPTHPPPGFPTMCTASRLWFEVEMMEQLMIGHSTPGPLTVESEGLYYKNEGSSKTWTDYYFTVSGWGIPPRYLGCKNIQDWNMKMMISKTKLGFRHHCQHASEHSVVWLVHWLSKSIWCQEPTTINNQLQIHHQVRTCCKQKTLNMFVVGGFDPSEKYDRQFFNHFPK